MHDEVDVARRLKAIEERLSEIDTTIYNGAVGLRTELVDHLRGVELRLTTDVRHASRE